MHLRPILPFSPFVMAATLALAACSGGPGNTTGSPAPGTAPLSSVGGVCEATCAHLAACGVPLGSDCNAKCEAATPSYRSCAGAANAASDCNALATCAFEASAQVNCVSGGGVPAGTGTCNAAALCEGRCNVSSAPLSCACACASAASPSVAIDLLINNSCAGARCPECNAPNPGPDCNACFDQKCGGVQPACAAH
jgi:hypothetical protein